MYRKPSHHPEPIQHLDKALLNITSSDTLPNVLVSVDFSLPHINGDTEDDENKYSTRADPQYGTAVNQAFLDMVKFDELTYSPGLS